VFSVVFSDDFWILEAWALYPGGGCLRMCRLGQAQRPIARVDFMKHVRLRTTRSPQGIPLAAVEESGRETAFLPGLRQQTPAGWVWRYGMAVAAVAAGWGFRLAMQAWVGPGLPTYVTFYPAVMAVALLAGFGPGLLATALTALTAALWILPPGGSAVASPVDRLGLAIFTSMGLFMSVVAELYRRSRNKAAAYDREAALRESQARLVTFAEATFEGIVESEAGRILDCNEQFARITGYSVAELRGLEIANLVAPEDCDRVLENIRQHRESTIEHAMLRKDGQRIVVESHGRPVSPGSARRHNAIRDITERKQAEDRTRQATEDWEQTFNTVPDLVAILDDQHRIVRANRAMADRLGVTTEQCIGLHCYESVHGTAQPPEFCPHVQTCRDGREHTAEVYESRLGGHFLVSTTPRLDEQGRLIGAVHIARDITARKRIEQEREIAVEFLRLVNQSRGTEDLVRAAVTFFQQQSGCEAVGLRLKDEDDYPYCEARGFSPEFVRLESQLCARDSTGAVVRDSAGYPICECMCGNVICGRFDPSQPFFTARGSFWTNGTTELLASTTEADRQARTRNRCNGEGYESVALIALAVGEDRLGLLQLNDRRPGRFTADGIALWERLAGYLAVGLAKTQAEETLRESQTRIRASLAEKEVLLKEIHHRVKNNMQVISSLVALQADELQDAALRAALQDVTHRVRSMALVHEKLYQSADLARVEFAEYARSLLNYLWRAHGTAAADVRLALDLEPVSISVNAAVPCGLILNELASNALKHAFPKEDSKFEATRNKQIQKSKSPMTETEPWEVRVALKASPEGPVCLRVRDNGKGLPPGTDWRQSRSLGLRLVQMLTGQLGGTVDVVTRPGEGTEFQVVFGRGSP
jgi:PAS domain S-box-containing protein